MSFSKAPVTSSFTDSPRAYQSTNSTGSYSSKQKPSGTYCRQYVNSGYGNSICGTQSNASSAVTSEWTVSESERSVKGKRAKNSRNLSCTSSEASVGGGEPPQEKKGSNPVVVDEMHSFIAEQSLKIALLEKETSVLYPSGGGTVQGGGSRAVVLANQEEILEIHPTLLEIHHLLSLSDEEEGGQTGAATALHSSNGGPAVPPIPSSIFPLTAKQKRKRNVDRVPLKELVLELKDLACIQRSTVTTLRQKREEDAKLLQSMEKELTRCRQKETVSPTSGVNTSRHDKDAAPSSHSTASSGGTPRGRRVGEEEGADDEKTRRKRDGRGGDPVFRFPSFEELKELQSLVEEWQQAHRASASTVQRLTFDSQQVRKDNEFLRDQLQREQKKRQAMRALYEKELKEAAAATIKAKDGAAGALSMDSPTPGAKKSGYIEKAENIYPRKGSTHDRSSSKSKGSPSHLPHKEEGSVQTFDDEVTPFMDHIFKGREYVMVYQSSPEAFKSALEEDMCAALPFLQKVSEKKRKISFHSEMRNVIVRIELPIVGITKRKKFEIEAQLMNHGYEHVEQLADRMVRSMVESGRRAAVADDPFDSSRPFPYQGAEGAVERSGANRHTNNDSSTERKGESETAVTVLLQELRDSQALLAEREMEIEVFQQRYEKGLQKQKQDAAEVDEAISQVLEESEASVEKLQKRLRKKEDALMTLAEKFNVLEQRLQEQEQQHGELSTTYARSNGDAIVNLQLEVTALQEERKALKEALARKENSSSAVSHHQGGEDGAELERGGRNGSGPARPSSSDIRSFTEVVDCTLPLSSIDLAEQLMDTLQQKHHIPTLHALLMYVIASRVGAIPLYLRRCAVDVHPETSAAVVRVRLELGFTCLMKDHERMSESLRHELDHCSTERMPELEEYLELLKEWRSSGGGSSCHSSWNERSYAKSGQQDVLGGRGTPRSLTRRSGLSVGESKELVDLLESILTTGERLSYPDLAEQLTMVKKKYHDMEENAKRNTAKIQQLNHQYRSKALEVEKMREDGGSSSAEEESGAKLNSTAAKLKEIIAAQKEEILSLRGLLESSQSRDVEAYELADKYKALMQSVTQPLPTSSSNHSTSRDGRNDSSIVEANLLQTLLLNATTEKEHLARKVVQLEHDLEDLVMVQRSLQDGMEQAQRSNRSSLAANEALKKRVAELEEEGMKVAARQANEERIRNLNRLSFFSFRSSSSPSSPRAFISSVPPAVVIQECIGLLRQFFLQVAPDLQIEEELGTEGSRIGSVGSHAGSGREKHSSALSPSGAKTPRNHDTSPTTFQKSTLDSSGTNTSPLHASSSSKAEEEEINDVLLGQLLSLVQQVGSVLPAFLNGTARDSEGEVVSPYMDPSHFDPSSSAEKAKAGLKNQSYRNGGTCIGTSSSPTSILVGGSSSSFGAAAGHLPSRTPSGELNDQTTFSAPGSRYAAWAAKRKAEMDETQKRGSGDQPSTVSQNSSSASVKEASKKDSLEGKTLGGNGNSSCSASSPSSSPSTRSSGSSPVLARCAQLLSTVKSNRLASATGKVTSDDSKRRSEASKASAKLPEKRS